MTNPMMRPISRLFAALALVFAGASAVPAQVSSPINNPGPQLPFVPITNYGVTTASSPTAVSTAFNTAIDACNAGTIGGIYWPTGIWSLLSNPHAWTNRCVVYGAGPTTLLVFPISDAAGATTFFQVGDDTHRVAGGAIHDLQLVMNNSPTQSTYAIDIPSATDFRVYNITYAHTNSPLRIGSSTASLDSSRIDVRGLTGDFGKDLNGDCNFNIVAGTNIDVEGVLNGTGVANTNATGAMVCMVPPTGKFIDTVTLDLRLQAFTGTISDLQGKPYGLLVDTTNGKVVNWTVTPRSFFDHTTVTGMLIKCSVGGTGGVEMAKIAPLRVSPDSGPAVVMDMNCGQQAQDISFISSRFFSRDGSIPFQILAPHDGGSTLYVQDQVTGAIFENTGTATLAGASINADGWAFTNWEIGRYGVTTPTGFTNAFSITNADLAALVIGPGSWPYVTNFISVPTWTVPNLSTRDIWQPSKFYAPVTNVYMSQYGVTCNGSTDDYAAMAAAISANSAGSVKFILPNGNCKFSQPLVFNGNSSYLTGAGERATILTYTGTPAAGVCAVTFSSATPTTTQLLEAGISDLKLTRSASASANGIGLCFVNTNQTRSSGVGIAGFYQGIAVYAGGVNRFDKLNCFGNSSFTFPAPAGSACFFEGSYSNGAGGFNNSQTVFISHSTFAAGGTAGSIQYGIWDSSSDILTVDDSYFGSFTTQAFLQPDGNTGVFITGAQFNNVRFDGGTNTASCADIEENSGNTGVAMYGIQFTGGVCDNNATSGSFGYIVNSRNAQVQINGVSITANLNPVYASSWRSLSVTGNDISQFTSGAAITVPAASRYGLLNIAGNNIFSTSGGTQGINLGSVGTGTAVVTLGSNNYGSLTTPTTIDASVTNIVRCGGVSTTTTLGCDVGIATATTINKVTVTPPATGSTLTIADGKTLTASNTLTLTATDGSTLAVGTGGTLGSNAYTSTAYAPIASPTFTGLITTPQIQVAGNISAASWGTNGLNMVGGSTITDTDTTTSGTVATEVAFAIPNVNFAATNPATTITAAALLYVPLPTAGTNVTLTNVWSIITNGGIRLSGVLQANAGLNSSGAAINLNSNSNFGVSINTGTSTGTTTIGNASNTGKLVIANLATGTNTDTVCLSAGNVVLIQAAACTISSRRFKENIKAWSDDALGKILQFPVYTFDLKDGKKNRDKNAARDQIGIMAEDVAKIEPKCALYEPDMKTPKSYRQECLIAVLIKSVQQLSAANDNLKQRIAKLERRNK